jgi:hypothetical protein
MLSVLPYAFYASVKNDATERARAKVIMQGGMAYNGTLGGSGTDDILNLAAGFEQGWAAFGYGMYS